MFLLKTLLVSTALVFASEPVPAEVPPVSTSAIEPRKPVKLPIELSDSTFDHDTQIGTHDTTGPWFVKFYAPWCGHCKRMEGIWNEFPDEVNGMVNIGSVDATKNRALVERFKITGYPTLLFFKDQKMYKYAGPRTVEGFKKFTLEEGYRKTEAAEIPRPLTLIDTMRKNLVSLVRDFEHVMTQRLGAGLVFGVAGASVGAIFGSVATLIMMKGSSKKSRKVD